MAVFCQISLEQKKRKIFLLLPIMMGKMIILVQLKILLIAIATA